MMDDIRVPIYLVTGFLESGKTTFLDFTLQASNLRAPRWTKPTSTLCARRWAWCSSTSTCSRT